MDKDDNELKLRDDEINLYDLWRVIVKRKKLIIGLFLISTISAAIISLLMPKVYRGEAFLKTACQDIIKTTGLSNDVSMQNITPEEIVTILGNFDRRKIEKFCPENAPKIISIKLSSLKKPDDMIKITVEARDNAILEHVFKNFVKKLNEDILLKPLIEQIESKLKTKKNELSTILKNSELVQSRMYTVIQRGNIGQLGFNPIDIDLRILDLKMQLSRVEELSSNPLGFEMINGGNISDKPVRPRISTNIVLAGMGSIFFGIFLAIFLEFIKKMKDKSRE